MITDNLPAPKKTTRTPIRVLAVALAMSLAPASRHAAATDAREAVRAGAGVLRGGAKRELKRPSAAAEIARDGDIIEIDAGVYDGDAAVWRQHRLTIGGLGGRVHLRRRGVAAPAQSALLRQQHSGE